MYYHPRIHPLVSRPLVKLHNVCYFKSKAHGYGMYACQPLTLSSESKMNNVFMEYYGEIIGKQVLEIRDSTFL